MGYLLPCLLALILAGTGNTIFHEPPDTSDNGPLASCYIFILSTFFLLWDQKIYPKTLRKQYSLVQYIIEFFLAEFVMEILLLDFWFPFEKTVIALPPKVAETVESKVKALEGKLDWLKNSQVGVVGSYAFSIFFLIVVLHGTRMIDLRTFEGRKACIEGVKSCYYKQQRPCGGGGGGEGDSMAEPHGHGSFKSNLKINGPSCFFNDLSTRLIRYMRKSLPQFLQDFFLQTAQPCQAKPNYQKPQKRIPDRNCAAGEIDDSRRAREVRPFKFK